MHCISTASAERVMQSTAEPRRRELTRGDHAYLASYFSDLFREGQHCQTRAADIQAPLMGVATRCVAHRCDDANANCPSAKEGCSLAP
jgi:hypothetical protein